MTSRLESVLHGLVGLFSGDVGYVLWNLASNERLECRPDEWFPTASVIKLPLLTACHAAADAGDLNWDRQVTIENSDIPGGSGILQFLDLPRTVSLRDAAWLMIADSDNLATNVLLKLLTIEGAGHRISTACGEGMRIHKLASYTPGAPVRSMGEATPRGLADYAARLAQGMVSGARETLRIARQQRHRAGIPRYLPTDPYGPAPLTIANKTGALPGIRTDLAVLEAGDVQMVMAILTRGSRDTGFGFMNEGEELIGRIARAAVEAWTPEVLTA